MRQEIAVFELQKLSGEPLAPVSFASRSPVTIEEKAAAPAKATVAPAANSPIRFQDRRLLCLFFDMTSMQPPEQLRAQEAAIKFLQSQMTSSDLVEIMTYTTSIKVVQEWTDDRDLLISTLKKLTLGEGSDLADVASTSADEGDDSGSFAADDTEFNIFNTDRKLTRARRRRAQAQHFSRKESADLFLERHRENGRRESVADQGDRQRRGARQRLFLSRWTRAAWSRCRPAATRRRPRRAAPASSPERSSRAFATASTIRRKRWSPSRPTPAARPCSTPTI